MRLRFIPHNTYIYTYIHTRTRTVARFSIISNRTSSFVFSIQRVLRDNTTGRGKQRATHTHTHTHTHTVTYSQNPRAEMFLKIKCDAGMVTGRRDMPPYVTNVPLGLQQTTTQHTTPQRGNRKHNYYQVTTLYTKRTLVASPSPLCYALLRNSTQALDAGCP